MYDVEPQSIEGGGPPHWGIRFSNFDIYLNDSINMENYLRRDLEVDALMPTKYQTKVINSGTTVTDHLITW